MNPLRVCQGLLLFPSKGPGYPYPTTFFDITGYSEYIVSAVNHQEVFVANKRGKLSAKGRH
jgi:hypothetical protein